MNSASLAPHPQSNSILSRAHNFFHCAPTGHPHHGQFIADDGFAVYSHLIDGTYEAGVFLDAAMTVPVQTIESSQSTNPSEEISLTDAVEPIKSASPLHPVSGRILTTSQIEGYCRKSIRWSSKQSFFPIYFAIEASVRYGNEWFAATQLLHALGKDSDSYFGQWIRDPLVEMGIAEIKLDGRVFYVRLQDELMDINHHHGKRALLIRQELTAYYLGKKRETPIAALLLIAIHMHSIFSARDLHQFLTPEILETNKCARASMTLGILDRLCQAGRLQGVRGTSRGRPLTVFPITEGSYV